MAQPTAKNQLKFDKILNDCCSAGPDAVKYIVNHAVLEAIFCVPQTLNSVSSVYLFMDVFQLWEKHIQLRIIIHVIKNLSFYS